MRPYCEGMMQWGLPTATDDVPLWLELKQAPMHCELRELLSLQLTGLSSFRSVELYSVHVRHSPE